jgi:oxalate decarboxylase/phosphoglucose isomerase-like protein (cupin superfamily)
LSQSTPGLEATWNPRGAYETWMAAQELPIYRGHAADLPDIELGWWAERECYGGFLYFMGMEDIHEARVIEIPAGKTLPPQRIALEELVYVVKGRGTCTVWAGDHEKRTFEWSDRSFFMIPPNYQYVLASMQGEQPARLMHTNFLPLALSAMPNVDYFLDNPKFDPNILYGDEANAFSEAKMLKMTPGSNRVDQLYVGNFFPDMAAWSNLVPHPTRGAGGTTLRFRSRTGKNGHMSVFPPQRYKLAHRHGPGRVIVIPKGEGFSIVGPPGLGAGEPDPLREDTSEVIPWKEGTVFTPPDQWYHQHFNTGTTDARYIAFGPTRQFGGHDESRFGVQTIKYAHEPAWIRAKFEAELAKHNLKSDIPEEAYKDPNYEWEYGDDD